MDSTDLKNARGKANGMWRNDKFLDCMGGGFLCVEGTGMYRCV
jgi:hypothetical protein